MSSDPGEPIDGFVRAAERAAHAEIFGWSPNRHLEEQGVLLTLAESLGRSGGAFFCVASIRGRGDRPSDLEGHDLAGRRTAFEVVELDTTPAAPPGERGRTQLPAGRPGADFRSSVGAVLSASNARREAAPDAPFAGGHVVVIYTDETELSLAQVERWLGGRSFAGLPAVDRAFLLLAYDPDAAHCPCVELAVAP